MTPDYGKAFALWRAEAGEVWRDYTHHTFVEQLGDGSLPRSCFLNYLRQDYVFLKHFSRAWALATVKAENLDEMRATSATVHALLHQEMGLHVGICAAEAISETDLEATQEEPENMAYTRYVLEAGYSGDFTSILAALAPCVLGYGEIGARLANETDTKQYRDWIDTYGGEDYQDVCGDTGKLLDGALERRFGPDWASLPINRTLVGHFTAATRLEVGFWDMGLRNR